jgi:hypothetical protein
VFRSFRAFNYELSSIYPDPFRATLGDDVDQGNWPALFIKFPTGFLDSPRNHILVAHEIGHAVAAVRRAETQRYQQEAAKAKRSGLPSSEVPPALLPLPSIPQPRLLDVVIARWNESGLSPLDTATLDLATLRSRPTESLLFADIIARVATTAQAMCASWMEELFADAVGVCLFGPAFIFSFIEVLMPVSGLQNADEDHPPGAMRLLWMEQLLRGPQLTGMIDAMPDGLRTRLDAWITMSAEEFVNLKTLGASAKDFAGKLQSLVTDIVEALADSIRKAALAVCAKLIYSPSRFKDDLSRYSDDLVLFGIPPVVAPPGQSVVGLATIFNVAQMVALERLEEFRPGEARPEKERMLDDLVLKAVELAEVQRKWQEA